MPQPTPHRGGTSITHRIALRWAMAGLIGLTFAVTAILRSPLSHAEPVLQATVAIAGGWLAMLLFGPWRNLRLIESRRRRLLRLIAELQEINRGARRRLSGSHCTAHDAELKSLARVLEDLVSRADTDRRAARALRRTMQHRIRRETERATGSLKRQATTDPLTGLGNRRAFDQWLADVLAANRRQRDDIALIVIDMDLFKQINDTLGHEAGDECLRFLGKLLRAALRHEDRAARLGGDEFVILMRGTTLPQAQRIGQRLSALFAQMPWPHTAVARPTLSVGLALASAENLEDAAALLRRADEALYESKRRGGNAVSTAA